MLDMSSDLNVCIYSVDGTKFLRHFNKMEMKSESILIGSLSEQAGTKKQRMTFLRELAFTGVSQNYLPHYGYKDASDRPISKAFKLRCDLTEHVADFNQAFICHGFSHIA